MTPGLPRALFWASLAMGPAALALWAVAGSAPALVEAWYSRGLYPALMGPVARFWALVPGAAAPWLGLALVAALGVTGWLAGPVRALLAALALASLALAWFLLGWALNYQRLPWAVNQGWTTGPVSPQALVDLTARLAEGAGEARRALAAAAPPDWAGPGLRLKVRQAWARTGAADPLLAGPLAAAKDVPFAGVATTLGLSGIFWPFTGEPLVNPAPGDWQLPFVAAHETAHLQGWAREDEANFLAFWVLRDDPDPALRLSAWSSALLTTVVALLSSGAPGVEAWSTLRSRVDPGLLEDWRRTQAWWDKSRGPLREVASGVNDLYLKSQGQAEGVKSYGRMVDLLLAAQSRF